MYRIGAELGDRIVRQDWHQVTRYQIFADRVGRALQDPGPLNHCHSQRAGDGGETRRETNDTMQIVLTATRHDVAMISEGRFTQPPDYVVVARIVMTTKGALEVAEAIKSTVAKHQAMTGRLHSSSGHA